MQYVSEPLAERFVTRSEAIVLECRCREKLILLGRETDWRKERRTVFERGGCKEKLSLDDIFRRRARA
jgi:hypothetical protein